MRPPGCPVHPSAQAIESVNTIVNTDGHLKAYNTDYIAVERLIAQHGVDPRLSFALRGSGGMAKVVAGALHHTGFRDGVIVARNKQAGRHLVELYGYRWQQDKQGLQAGMLVNVTPLGMAGGAESETLAFSHTLIAAASVVFDVVAMPAETPLIQAARALQKPVITGAEVVAIQSLEQFVLYTGERPDPTLVARAAAHAAG